MARVSDERLAELLESHAQAWLNNREAGPESESGGWWGFKDLESLLIELQQCRAQETDLISWLQSAWAMANRSIARTRGEGEVVQCVYYDGRLSAFAETLAVCSKEVDDGEGE